MKEYSCNRFECLTTSELYILINALIAGAHTYYHNYNDAELKLLRNMLQEITEEKDRRKQCDCGTDG